MQLKEGRLRRQVPSWSSPRWQDFEVVELAGHDRFVFDFVACGTAIGCRARSAEWAGPVRKGEIVMAASPPDFHGKLIKVAADAALQGEAALVVFEGPRAVTWDGAAKIFLRAGRDVRVAKFISTEFGEATARRRVCLVAYPNKLIGNPMDTTTCRSLLAPPMAPHLEPTKTAPQSLWITPEKLVMDAGIPREPLLPLLKGHFWMDGVRKCLTNTGGPLRWPLRVPGEARVEDCIVHDPRGPCGKVRRLTPFGGLAMPGKTE